VFFSSTYVKKLSIKKRQEKHARIDVTVSERLQDGSPASLPYAYLQTRTPFTEITQW
jgi:hypothetical protein